MLAEQLRKPSPHAILTPDIVIIPQAAVRRWLQTVVAARCGIVANVRFITPSEFVGYALDAHLPSPEDAISTPILQWRLYAALRDQNVMQQPVLARFAHYLADGDPLKPWSLATELNHVFETYAVWRRDWLIQWEANASADDTDPQAFLWRVIAKGQRHRARRVQEYLARFGQGARHLNQGLPSRLFVFATLNISPDIFQVITTQARVGTLHFYLPSPTANYWGDLQRSMIRPTVIDGLAVATSDDNPLLQAWGQAGREFMAMLGDHEIIHPSVDLAAYADPEDALARHNAEGRQTDSLLRRIQADIFHRRGVPDPPPRQKLDVTDPSLQIHACHTRLRELQVVFDQLHALFDDPRFSPRLQLHEVAILAADISLYAPYLNAVFRRMDRAGSLAFSLADNHVLATKPFAALFLRLLDLPVWRFSLLEIFAVLSAPPMPDILEIDAQTLQHLKQWLYAAGARWGLDCAHRQALQAPAVPQFTWQYALDRLFIGHAIGEAHVVAGVAAYPGMDSSTQRGLNIVLRLLTVLARYQKELSSALTASEWRDRLLGLLDALLPSQHQLDSAMTGELESVRSHINTFARDVSQAQVLQTIPIDVVKAYFTHAFNHSHARAPLITGGIQIGQMVPMRLIPFRVICLLGLNDGEFPRNDPVSGLNRLTADLETTHRRVGDRSLRDEDRFLFLQLLNAAQDVFYVSYLGADPHDGSQREPSPIISELIDVAAAYHVDAADAIRDLIVRHPLHPYSPDAFGRSDSRCFSYHGDWHHAAQHVPHERESPSPWLRRALPAGHISDSTSMRALQHFYQRPVHFFLQRRLQLHLTHLRDNIDAHEPFLLPERGFLRQQLEETVLSLLRADEKTQTIIDHATAAGFVPPSLIGVQHLTELITTLRPHAHALTLWSKGEKPVTHRLRVPIGNDRLSSHLPNLYPHGLVFINTHPRSGSAVVAHGLNWLLAAAAKYPVPLITFDKDANQTITPRVVQPALDPDVALHLFSALLRLLQLGIRRPLPFSAWSGWEYYSRYSDQPKTALSAARSRWIGNENGWSEQNDPSTRRALQGFMPFIDPAATQLFQRLSHVIFDALTLGQMTVSDLDDLEYHHAYWQ